MLGDQLHTDELINLIPDFATLTEDFGLDYSMAFQVLRARLRVQIVNEDNDKLALLRERLKAQKEASAAGAGGTVTPPLSPTPVTPPLSAVALPSQAGDDAQPNGESVPEPKVVSAMSCVYSTRADIIGHTAPSVSSRFAPYYRTSSQHPHRLGQTRHGVSDSVPE